MGKRMSLKRDEFPLVIQSDMTLFPERAGCPVIDLSLIHIYFFGFLRVFGGGKIIRAVNDAGQRGAFRQGQVAGLLVIIPARRRRNSQEVCPQKMRLM